MNAMYTLQSAGNILLAVVYVLGALTFLFPNASQIVQPFGTLAVGVALLTTGLFGSPYYTHFENDEEPPCEPKRGCEE
jgi:hypothetical protein